ncbi:MAG: hypothetical protein JW751_07640 [Polyangiaceae bacterium]|nr:hypothetical protein [Polyangiaceae bacterium]
MGIDGIGKPGPGAILPPFAAPLAPAASGADPIFPALSPEASAEIESGPLMRLERGDITLDQYLDLRVDAAMAHLPALPPSELGFVRDTLRADLASDPALVDLVRRATASSPVDPRR